MNEETAKALQDIYFHLEQIKLALNDIPLKTVGGFNGGSFAIAKRFYDKITEAELESRNLGNYLNKRELEKELEKALDNGLGM